MKVTDVPNEDLMSRQGEFGKWVVVSYAGKQRHKSSSGATHVTDMWNCECSCGRTKQVICKGNLVNGLSTQCRRCSYEQRSKPDRPHLVFWWKHRMEMCSAWQDEAVFGVFYAGRTGRYLLRRDRSLPYSPENCYWSDRTVKGLLFRSKLVGLRMLLLGETFGEAEAWFDSVTHQRRYQWFSSYSSEKPPKRSGRPRVVAGDIPADGIPR